MVGAVATGAVVAWTDTAHWSVVVHVGAAGIALAASLTTVAMSFRGTSVPMGPWRDYVTLTKPRIMIAPPRDRGSRDVRRRARASRRSGCSSRRWSGLALACGGASALNHVLDADIDKLMGERTRAGPSPRAVSAAPRALEFGLALSGLSFALLASTVNVLTAVLALVGNLFYVLVYTRLAEALDAAEHRDRRRRRRGAAARRLGRRDRRPGAPGAVALPDRLPLDAAALLGARADDQGALRERGRPDAPRCRGRCARPRARSSSTRSCWSRSRRGRSSGSAPSTSSPPSVLGAVLPRARVAPARDGSRRARGAALPLLARLPRAALRGGGDRPGRPLGKPGALGRGPAGRLSGSVDPRTASPERGTARAPRLPTTQCPAHPSSPTVCAVSQRLSSPAPRSQRSAVAAPPRTCMASSSPRTSPPPRLPAHARVLVGTRAWRALLRVRARDQSNFTESAVIWSNVAYGVGPAKACQPVPADTPATATAPRLAPAPGTYRIVPDHGHHRADDDRSGQGARALGRRGAAVVHRTAVRAVRPGAGGHGRRADALELARSGSTCAGRACPPP